VIDEKFGVVRKVMRGKKIVLAPQQSSRCSCVNKRDAGVTWRIVSRGIWKDLVGERGGDYMLTAQEAMPILIA
jgi:hypothetical protein